MWSQGHKGIVALPAPSSFGLFQYLPWTPADTPSLQAGDGAEVMQAFLFATPASQGRQASKPMAADLQGKQVYKLNTSALGWQPTSSVHPKPFWVPDRSNRTVACCQARDQETCSVVKHSVVEGVLDDKHLLYCTHSQMGVQPHQRLFCRHPGMTC